LIPLKSAAVADMRVSRCWYQKMIPAGYEGVTAAGRECAVNGAAEMLVFLAVPTAID
jgi:hypothetical protein